MTEVDIESVPFGTMIYSLQGSPLGVVTKYRNAHMIQRRHLNNGKHADRFAYRREKLYQMAKAENGGKVLVK